MKPDIGIKEKNLVTVCSLLNKLLADEYVLYTKTLNYHWNVKGMMFNDLHLFFERQYKELFDIVDAVAERVTTLGEHASGTLDAFLKQTRLQESNKTMAERDMLKDLLTTHELIIKALRVDIDACTDEYHDMGTNNFLTELIEKHEKMAWMLRAYLS